MITDFIGAHPHLAYGVVFLLALSEAVPIVGAVVPGSAIIIAASALVPFGILKLWPILIAAIFGAIVGDGASYWLGHRYHEDILGRWPLNRYPGVIEKAEAFLHRHGGKSVFLARFIPALRAFVPLVAGILRLPIHRFYFANVISALVWAPAHILPGVLVGASFHLAGGVAERLAALLAALLVALWLVVWLVRLAVRRGVPVIETGQQYLWAWARSRDTWLSYHVRSLLDPERSETRVLALWAAIVLGAAWIFFGILEDIVSRNPLVQLDAAIYQAFQNLRTPFGDALMIAITELGDTAVVLPLAAIVFLWLTWQRAWRAAVYWVAVIGFAALLNTGIKLLIHRARPADLLYTGPSVFSFPSGHATVNAVMYGFLTFLIVRQLHPVWRVPLFGAVAILAALMAFSRLYLGAHWFSDVAASLTFATAWVIVLGIVYLRHGAPRINVAGLAVVACAALALVGGLNVYFHHKADARRYAVQYAEPAITASDWWAGDWRQLPEHRIDLTGEVEEPLTLQWAGSLKRLEDELFRNGWRRPEPWTVSNALAWLASNPDPLKLPTFPNAQGGRLPSLTLIRTPESNGRAASRIVLRLWAANFQLRNGSTLPLWVGSVVEERLYRPLSLFTLSVTQPDANGPRQLLVTTIEGGRLVQRSPFESNGEWDGRVLLAREKAGTLGGLSQQLVSRTAKISAEALLSAQ